MAETLPDVLADYDEPKNWYKDPAISTKGMELTGPHSTTALPDLPERAPSAELRNPADRPDQPDVAYSGPNPIAAGGDFAHMAVESARNLAKGDIGKSSDYWPLLMGVFAGPRAKTAPLGRMKTAQDMELKGSTPEAIWNKSGWWRAPHGWMWEIPDQGMKYQAGHYGDRRGFLNSQLRHEKLHEAYPEAANQTEVTASHDIFSPQEGGFSYSINPDPGDPAARLKVIAPTREDLLRTAAHEANHFAFNQEGWSTGASPTWFQLDDPSLLALVTGQSVEQPLTGSHYERSLLRSMHEMLRVAGAHNQIPFMRRPRDIGSAVGQMIGQGMPSDQVRAFINELSRRTAFDLYHKADGEAYADAAMARQSMNQLERRQRPGWEDLPEPTFEIMPHEHYMRQNDRGVWVPDPKLTFKNGPYLGGTQLQLPRPVGNISNFPTPKNPQRPYDAAGGRVNEILDEHYGGDHQR